MRRPCHIPRSMARPLLIFAKKLGCRFRRSVCRRFSPGRRERSDKVEDVTHIPLCTEVNIIVRLTAKDDLPRLSAVQAISGEDRLFRKVLGKLGDSPAGFVAAMVQ